MFVRISESLIHQSCVVDGIKMNTEAHRSAYSVPHKPEHLFKPFYKILLCIRLNAGFSGGSRGSPLFLDQTEVQRAKKIFLETHPPPPPPPPPPI